MNFAQKAGSHLYQNYAMRDRLQAFRAALQSIRDCGYAFWTAEEFARRALQRRRPEEQVCVLRVDVDTDARGAAKMFDMANALGIRGTYYFRLSTMDPAVIRRIAQSGSEIGYHYEEIAAVARRRGFRDREEVDGALQDIRQEFRRNLAQFGSETDVAPRTIAAHGDFLNRRLRVTNDYLLTRSLLDESGIVAEMNESWVAGAFAARITDRPSPVWWHPEPLASALEKRPQTLCLLVHPRQWVRNPVENTKRDAIRLIADIAYRWNRYSRRSAG